MPNKQRVTLLLLCVLIYGVYFLLTSQRFWNHDATDFPSYYYATKATFDEELLPYSRSSLLKVAAYDGKDREQVLPFLYLPPSLVLFSPFINLEYETAKRLMLLINLALVFILLYVILKILEEKPGSWFSLFSLVYAILFVPLIITIDYGQVNILVVTLICSAWYLAKRNRNPIWVALLLSLAIVLKLYPILLLIPFWVRKEYKVVWFTLLIFTIMVLITLFILPKGIWSNWYKNIGSVGYGLLVQGVRTTIPANQSIYGFLARLFYGSNVRFAPLLTLPSRVTDSAPYIVVGLLLCISSITSFVLRTKARASFDFDISFWLVVSYLVAPISWYHHMVFILPAILVTIHYLVYKRRNIRMLIPVILISLFWLFEYPSNSPLFRHGIGAFLMSVPLYITSIFWIFLALTLLQIKKKLPEYERSIRQDQVGITPCIPEIMG